MAILKDLIVQGPSRFIGEAKGTKFVTEGGTSSQFVKGDGSLDSTEYVAITKGTKTYTGVIGTADNNPGAVFYFLSVKPKDWNAPCVIKYRISASMAGQVQGTAQSVMSLCFCRNTVPSYDVWNYIGNTSYRPYYYHYRYLVTETGYNAGYGHLVGIGLQSSYTPTNSTYARTFVIDVLEAENCDFTFLSSMTKYASVPGTGSTNFSGESTFDATTNGETHTSDRNTTNLISLSGGLGPAGSLGIFPYTLIMQEGNGSWSPIVTSYSTGTTKTVNSAGFRTDLIFYYYNSSTAAANAVNITGLYSVTTLDFRYSANCGTTLTNSRPIYLVGTFNPDDGLFYLDSTTWWSQEVDPNGNPTRYIDSNGEVKYIHKAYILLGQTYSTYQIQLYPDHPIYYGYNGEVKPWSKESEKEEIIYRYPRLESDYLTFEALSDGTMGFSGESGRNISYSIDNGETWSEATTPVTIDVSEGDKIMWKGEMTPNGNYGIGKFNGSAAFAAYGNPNSLLYGDNFVGQHVVANAFRGRNAGSYEYMNVNGSTTSYLGAGLFYNTRIVNASGLFLDDTLADRCYESMFYKCTSLTTPPQFSVATLATGCYGRMFAGCTALKTAPSLPTTTLAQSCYSGMFLSCTSLREAPQLSATTLANNCYEHMFYGCYNLTTPPQLPATTLANYCYAYMFYRCSSLDIPTSEYNEPIELLPATTLADYCYSFMFYGCTSLRYLYIGPSSQFWNEYSDEPEPEVLFEGFTLATACFSYMFAYCRELRGFYINLNYNLDTVPSNCFRGTFSNCSSLQLFEFYLPAATLTSYCYANMFENCTSLEYPPDLYDVTTLASHCCESMFKGCTSLYNTASMGNVTTLADYCFSNMYNGCTSLVSSSSLPNVDLASFCYYHMFQDCTSLSTPPELPATTLANNCYASMFQGCTSLTTTPTLPATTLANYCYADMFALCSSLTIPPQLPATTLANNCYYNMFQDCTSLTTTPELQATTLQSGCYSGMFQGCTSLTTAPTLPATTLTNSCYYYMFNGCTSLTAVPSLPATTLDSYCYSSMFQGCTSLKEAPDILATAYASSCFNRMFQGCTSLEKAPNIQTETAQSDSHDYMFSGCTSLNFIHNQLKTVTNTTTSSHGSSTTNSPIDGWLNNVAEVGIYVKPDNGVTWTNINIPAGWTVMTESQWANYQLEHPDELYSSNCNFIVTATYSSENNNWTADKTAVAVKNAVELGKSVYLKIVTEADDETLTELIPLIYMQRSAYGSYTIYYQAQSLNYPWEDPAPERILYRHYSTTVYKSTIVLATKEEAGAIPIENHGTSDTTFALTPNIQHKWGSVSSLTLTLATPDDSSRVNEYLFSFTSPSTPTTLSLPATVEWAIELDIEANKTYYVSIVDNLATFLTAGMTVNDTTQTTYATKVYVDEIMSDLEDFAYRTDPNIDYNEF